jgi:vacuolar-type H+-ATPase subunit B/Vma2
MRYLGTLPESHFERSKRLSRKVGGRTNIIVYEEGDDHITHVMIPRCFDDVTEVEYYDVLEKRFDVSVHKNENLPNDRDRAIDALMVREDEEKRLDETIKEFIIYRSQCLQNNILHEMVPNTDIDFRNANY